ncbi:hypothetical protein D3C81_1771850 [compost metagenome]
MRAVVTPMAMPSSMASAARMMVFKAPNMIALAVRYCWTYAHSIWPLAKAWITPATAPAITAARAIRP